MGGISIDVETTGLSELLDQLREARGDLREQLEDALAEQAIEFSQNLRGSGPGVGLTPFRTGRLLLSGNITQDGLNLSFENDAPYAEWAHKAGGDKGDYAKTTGQAFEARFGEELEEIWAEVIEGALDD